MGRAIIGFATVAEADEAGRLAMKIAGRQRWTSVKVQFQEPDLIRRSLFVLLRADD